MANIQTLIDDLNRLRSEGPLVHNITNYVVMNWTANCLLTVGASPVMAHAKDEIHEMVEIARSLVINIGTLSHPWLESMVIAMRAARTRGIPVVLDPVGAGATQFRTESAKHLLESGAVTVLRGNASEILGLAENSTHTKGVDSAHSSDEAVLAAKYLSREYNCVVCVSGETDFVISKESSFRLSNGHPIMTRVTGMGCAATALIGAFLTVQNSPLLATAHAMALMGVVGELAVAESRGPGSFQSAFLDHLSCVEGADLSDRVRIETQ